MSLEILLALFTLCAALCLGGTARAQVDAGVATALEATDAGRTPAAYSAVATATRLARPLRHVSAAVTVIPRAELDQNPALTTDSVLRSVPSLATFRRSTSLTADPSAQGLNLRGVGPSGVSRSLVLLDGVPVNDPFAGSVYFRALPRLGIERAEIVPGGGSALYGSSALSGVVQLFSRGTEQRAREGELSYGRFDTVLLAVRAAGALGSVSGALEGEWLRSNGYALIAKSQRGPIDRAAASEHGNLNGKLVLRASERLTLAASGSFFRQELQSTRYTSAAAQLSSAALRARYDGRRHGTIDVLWFGRLARFEQERARVADARSSEQLAARQRVPAGDLGVSLTWSNRAPTRQAAGLATDDALGHHVLLGADARYALGTSHERIYPAEVSDTALRRRSSGGRQLLLGAFIEELWRLHAYLQLEGALRVDLIRDEHGQIERESYGGEQSTQAFSGRNRLAFNPRLGVLVELHRTLRLRASGYRSFRAATLNELYRPFQVGTVLTAANPTLRPETLWGGELGLEQHPWHPLSLRAVGFYNLLDDPIVNATLAAPLPDGSMRQRRNVGRARVAGLELAADMRLFARLSLVLAYTFVDARVTKQGALDGLRGKRLAQDPRQRLSALLFFDEPRWFSAALQVRYLGMQYEDDLNTLRMRPYATVDLSVTRRLFWQLELYLAVENLLDQEYLVGRAGVDTLGQPLFVRGGLRVREPTTRR